MTDATTLATPAGPLTVLVESETVIAAGSAATRAPCCRARCARTAAWAATPTAWTSSGGCCATRALTRGTGITRKGEG